MFKTLLAKCSERSVVYRQRRFHRTAHFSVNSVGCPPPSAYPWESWSLPHTCPLSGNTAMNKQRWQPIREPQCSEPDALSDTPRPYVLHSSKPLSSIHKFTDWFQTACAHTNITGYIHNQAECLSGTYTNTIYCIFIQHCSLVNLFCFPLSLREVGEDRS